MKRLLPLIAFLLAGCTPTKVLFVDPANDVLRLGKARGEWFVQDSKGEWIRSTGPLPVGWYVVPDTASK